ncbi:MAG: 2-hydroxy-3-keto-5-methylthiopentenyl-1-phosphate phosphatase [Candidatus Pristimantibacillus sp.]
MTLQPKKRIIFCDFDGTITVNDNIIAIIRHFNPPGWESIVESIVSEKISIRDGVGQMFHLLPASMQQEVIDYSITNARIRDGFPELLAYCKEQEIEFYVTSGGIDFFVYPILEQFGIPQDHIYCNSSDFTGETIRITWPHACDHNCTNDCGMCKTTIIRRFPKSEYEQILIGDSVTDFQGAKLVDVVFSRSILTDKCKELGLPYHEFENFHDIIGELKKERA